MLQKYDFIELRENLWNFKDNIFAKQYCVFMIEINPQKLKENISIPNYKHILKPEFWLNEKL